MEQNELILSIKAPKGYEVDIENSTTDKLIFVKKKDVNAWKDLSEVTGYYIEDNSDIKPVVVEPIKSENRNIFAKEKYARAALALAQISQLLPYYDTELPEKIDYENTQRWVIVPMYLGTDAESWLRNKITPVGIMPVTFAYTTFNSPLSFNTKNEACRFFTNNIELVRDFYLLDGLKIMPNVKCS